MDMGENVLLKLSVPTYEITTLILQEVLSSSKKVHGKEKVTEKILEKLWEHIMTKLFEFDDQLLCSTCFYTLLTHSETQDIHLHNILNIINNALEEFDKDNSFYAMTIMYGLFQSSYLTQKNKQQTQLMVMVLEATFKLLMQEAYKYSQYTFITFKIISAFKKVIDTNFQSSIFNRNNQITLLNVVNHNWENPITGVRNLIRNIFQTLVSILDKDIYDTILKEINGFYWNKAKFLMLTEVIEQSQSPIYALLNNNGWLHGLIYSLHKPGLVSCGSDMYFAVLKKVKSDDEWCEIFLKDLCIIFNGTSYKAIENFYNYWCLITLKKFPMLLDKLLLAISKEKTESSLLSALSVMKQGNKLALLKKSLDTEKIIELGLGYNNPLIRIKAFDIICVCHGKCLPDRLKYNMILEFLYNNINSDCTVLRINMINSFSSFLTHLHSAFLINQDIEELKHFFLNLQNLLKASINFNGNYQRKITSIKLIDVILKHLNAVPKKSSKLRPQTLIEILKNESIWNLSSKDFILKLLSLLKDPADDIRQSVLQVLLNYYSNDLKCQLMFNYMTEDVIKCTESKFFFDIDCGKIIFKLLISILLKENIDGSFRSVQQYFEHWYNELTNEIHLKRNVVDSIHDGKQLHSILGWLFVIIESCLQYKYKLDLPNTTILKFVDVLEEISNQFMSEESSAVSYDFSRMNELVESLIEKSSTNIKNNDETKISGLHQVVLNCLWLNVKMSSDISALLIMYVEDENICNKCLNVIVHVLETCRHKGAIEAAGSALGKSIQHLTSLPVGSNLTKLPLILLERKLKELLLEAKMASVTRRGAGLSIMVHRIVSSDMKKGKPLFHYFMNILLEAYKDLDGINDCNPDKDLPKAIHIHFLTRIVMDSSLASEMMFYSAKLAELAFNNLRSSHWQIRNAALQLYGALIPKLIGQKKASGLDEETVSTVACDEFRTHSPKLWDFIENQLENTDDNLLSHSDLVPILNILASVARSYNFSYKSKEILKIQNFKLLLGSQIYTVRRLASNCILNIYSCQDIYTFLMSYDKISENSLHGTMFLLEGFLKLFKSELSDEKFCELKEKYSCLFRGRCSYLSRTIFDKMFFDEVPNMCKVSCEARNNKYLPGVYVWANNRIQMFIRTATWNEIADNIHILLTFDDFEQHSQHLYTKIDEDENIPEVLINIANKIISSGIGRNCYGVWKFIYKLTKTLTNHLMALECTHIVKELLIGIESLYKIRYLIPFAAKILSNSQNNVISKIIYDFCDPIKNETDMRYIAALANNELAEKFINLTDEVKINSIKSAIILLQDEDEDIRNTSTAFYKNIKKEHYHAFICLIKILSKEFMDSVLNEPKQGVNLIFSDLNNIIELIIEKDIENYNPFANDSKNIYLEDNFIKTLLHNLCKKYE
ncbi:uncharacterized protein LOC125051482 isoform X1 [Pieris napi]|uniref:uncharacterized protein LOC125051482 isoform X1 n=1 Tax=Pieris napi TaxID=78633 RepID=UPI001FB8D430|nr:uncharacterized protein LOC125051482 isoform X1 [Pieris napi]XP_047507743.1 uncharacterized protein LOC125051482 isoform X1 [Pieris napi]